MANERYNLTWHSFSDHLQQMFQSWRDDESSQDVTLICDDKTKIKAHQMVLKACSPVFASMLEGVDHPKPVIFLRGVQHQELESILQFLYLGEATFYEERMNEFLNVAKILEIKELSKDIEMNDERENQNNEREEESLLQEEPVEEDRGSSENIISLTNTGSNCSQCPDCGKDFLDKYTMTRHYKTIHQTKRYSCDQCDYKSSRNDHLNEHIKTKHEGKRYPCSQCDYQATQTTRLKQHVQSVHEGKRYLCSQCDYQATQTTHLKQHVQSVHEGMKYPCNECCNEYSYKGELAKHISRKH